MEYDPTLNWRDVKDDGFNEFVGPMRFATLERADDTPVGQPRWQLALALDRRHVNLGGVCHGGVLMATADVAMGISASRSADGHRCATVDFQSHFLAAAKIDHWLVVSVRLNRLVSGLAFMEAETWCAGRKCFVASGIWKMLSSGAPPERAERR